MSSLTFRRLASSASGGCRHGVNWGMQGMLYRRSSLADLRERWQHTGSPLRRSLVSDHRHRREIQKRVIADPGNFQEPWRKSSI